jgi:histidinol-phosphate aminotransferase
MNENTFSCLRYPDFPPYKPSNQEVWFLPFDARPLKLDWNESALPPSPKVIEATRRFLARPNALNWYPDADAVRLRDAIAKRWEVPRECTQTYCGSDSALQAVVKVFTRHGDSVLMVSPTYDNFRIYALEAECRVILDGPEDIFNLCGEDLHGLIREHAPRLVYLPNPNNPTGWLISSEDLVSVTAEYQDVMFVIDEAYAEFSGETAIPAATHSPNIMIARTFSKAYGLAGVRVGYVLGSAGNIHQLSHIRNGKNVSMLAQIAAVEALEDQDYLSYTLGQITEGDKILCKALDELGIFYRTTPANFTLIKVENAAKLQSDLAAQRIYIRSMSHLKGMEGYLRITLGSPDQMRRLAEGLKQLLG